MSGGVTTYRVVEPASPWGLRSRLLRAAEEDALASFDAVSTDDPLSEPARRTFTVKVASAQFDAPQAFDVTDEDGHLFQIKLPELFGPVEFDLFT